MIWSLGPSVSSLLTLLRGSVNRLRGGSSSRNLQMQIGLVWEPVIAKHRKARTRFKVLECGLSFAPIRFQKTSIVQVHPLGCIRNVILPFSKVQNVNWSAHKNQKFNHILKLFFLLRILNTDFFFFTLAEPTSHHFAAFWAGSALSSFSATRVCWSRHRRYTPEWGHEDQLLNLTNFACLTQPPLELSCFVMRMAAISCSSHSCRFLLVVCCPSKCAEAMHEGFLLADLEAFCWQFFQALGCRNY